jgi:nicotinate dehydrogenase subunit A
MVTLKVNGKSTTLDLDPQMRLLYVLTDYLEQNGPKFGCGLGQCGACTVIVEGEPIRSCITPVSAVEGFDITTLDGLGTLEEPHPIQKAFIAEQAPQCGFCSSGVILTAKVIVERNPNLTEAQIDEAMTGVICRCCSHVRMVKAIKRYAEGVRV